MKKLGLILLCFLLIGCGTKKEEEVPKTESQQFKEEYEKLNGTNTNISIDENVKVTYLDVEGLLEFLNTGTGILYIGYADDDACRMVLPLLLETAVQNDQTIYYFDMDKMNNNTESLTAFYNKIDAYLLVVDDQKFIVFPDVYALKDGQIVGHYAQDIYDDETYKPVLSEEDKILFQENYQVLMSALK